MRSATTENSNSVLKSYSSFGDSFPSNHTSSRVTPSKSKQSKQKWSFLSWLGCCSCDRPLEDDHCRLWLKNNGESVLTSAHTLHYAQSISASLLETKTQEPAIQAPSKPVLPCGLHACFQQQDELILLGVGCHKLIARVNRLQFKQDKAKATYDMEVSNSNKRIYESLEEAKRQLVDSASNKNDAALGLSRQQVFSLYDNGIKVTASDWGEVTPEPIAEHISKHFEKQFVIDALCGCGGNTVQVLVGDVAISHVFPR